ncbi:Hvo_1808 family surface protein [Haloglomus litoreum]|uniref:Hvo_1808 family surface protein n=1 Tax=Haloglomus litoreum TaxID=3034026 RepID=UPI0023E7DA44|nr:Hvo_1808 family surface protein [Haloglomus sp. DT116]
MRTLPALLVVALVVLAGCSTGFTGSPLGDDAAPEPTAEPTPTPTDAGDAGPDDSTAGPDDSTDEPTATPGAAAFDFADPATDRLGWEDGYWYNESVAYNATDGLNATERQALVARSMARVEHLRQLEFRETVPVRIINRSTYREQYAGGGANYTAEFRTFDNAKFEAMFLIGEDRDSLNVQNSNRGSNVLGFYSPRNDSIVVVSESTPPKLRDELTLGHELTHALQDQVYNLTNYTRPTREVYNAYNGLFEGDSHYTEQLYRQRCNGEWSCLSLPSEGAGGGGGGDIHFGVYFLNFFPYSDGPPFVRYHRDAGGWDRVNAMYDDPPASSEQVIYPAKYGEDQPTNVSLQDRNGGVWERVRPAPPREGQRRPAYASLGQSAMSAMFAYTLTDPYNRSVVDGTREFINREGGRVDRQDPFNYDLRWTSGWDGDRMHVYRNATAAAETNGSTNATAYVWKSVWDSPEEAREFARGYRLLLEHWKGQRVSGDRVEYVYEVDRLPFEDAFRVRVDGDTVVITNAPTVDALDAVRPDRPATGGVTADGSEGTTSGGSGETAATMGAA